jgi:hypothetical protein
MKKTAMLFAIPLETFHFAAMAHTGKFSRTNQAVAS